MRFPRVLLIGGAPMAGKSSVAKLLAKRHDRSVISTDDLGIAVQAARHGRQPDIAEDHREYYLLRTVDQLWRESFDRLRSLQAPIEAVARQHAHDWAAPAIVEGWAVLPSEIEDRELDIDRVWLIASKDLLEARMRADRAFWAGARDEEEMITKFVERSLRLNQYLFEAANERSLRLLEVATAEPLHVLADRIEALFGSPH
jgi:2-phosphoglycerate kinase